MESAKHERRLFQRRRFWVLLIAFVGLWYAFWELNQPEPVYSNEPLSTWMARMADPATAAQAANVLREMGPEAVPTLVDALHENTSPRTEAAYQLVARLNLAPRRPYDAPNIRATAAYLLGQMGTNAAPAVPDLVQTLGDPDAHVRVRAGRALSQIGAPAVTILMAALAHEEATVRIGAAKALGLIGRDARVAEQALLQRTNDARLEVREAAARAVDEIRK